jgi:perosamine synthetase
MNKKRSDIIRKYLEAIKDIKNIKQILPFEPEKYSYWLFGVRCKNRDKLISFLKSNGIATGVHYVPLHLVNYFSQWKSECNVAEKVWQEFVTLPLHVQLSDIEIEFVVDKLKEFEKNNF